MATTVGRWALRVPTSGDNPDVPADFLRLATDLSNVSMDDQGVLSARPVSTVGAPSNKPGRYWYVTGDGDATQNGRLWRDTGAGWVEVQMAVVEPGDMKASARASSVGWLLCDGSAVPRTTYAALFAAIGTTYGIGNGSTTFNVPDLRERVPVGAGPPGGIGTRLNPSIHGVHLGATGGTGMHTLTTAEMPAHTHPILNTAQGSRSTATPTDPTLNEFLTPGALSLNTGSTGGGGAHSNAQPYQIVNWFVKF